MDRGILQSDRITLDSKKTILILSLLYKARPKTHTTSRLIATLNMAPGRMEINNRESEVLILRIMETISSRFHILAINQLTTMANSEERVSEPITTP